MSFHLARVQRTRQGEEQVGLGHHCQLPQAALVQDLARLMTRWSRGCSHVVVSERLWGWAGRGSIGTYGS